MAHDLREVLRLREGERRSPRQSFSTAEAYKPPPESGGRSGYDGASRHRGSKAHIAVDTPGHLLALHVTSADEQDRAQVGILAEQVKAAIGESVELAWVDQGYTGAAAANAASQRGIHLEVVKLSEAKKGFVLLPRRWVVERTFGWTNRFRRLVRDFERLPQTVAGMHFFAPAYTSSVLSPLDYEVNY